MKIHLALAATLLLVACGDSSRGRVNPVNVGGGSSSSGGVTGVNRAPTAVADVAVVKLNSTNNALDVLANDSDPDGDSLTIISASAPKAATASGVPELLVSADGKLLRFTPPAGFVGVQPVLYTISDGRGGTSQATALITVSPLTLPSAAVPDVFTLVNNGEAASLNVLANDIDGAGGGLTLSSAASTATVPPGVAGSVSVAGGLLRYQPRAGFVGVETLSYVITDANGATATAPVIVTVLPLAAPPVAVPDVASTVLNSSLLIPVLTNDVDLAGGGLTVTATSSLASVPPLANGSFTVEGNQVRYTPPNASFVGVQTASYSLRDANGSTASGLITVVVSPVALAVPPLAVADVASLNSSAGSATLAVLGNDIDPAGGGLTITSASLAAAAPPADGTVVASDGGRVTISPPAGYVGVLTLTYSVRDINGQTSSAPIILTVAPISVPPVAVPDVAVVPQAASPVTLDVLVNDIDPAGGGLSLSATTLTLALPADASIAVSTNGSTVTVTRPAGYAGVITLGYTVIDANGQTGTGVATLTVSPLALAAPPLALPDIAIVAQDSGTTLINVLTNDVDPSGSGLSLGAPTVLASLPMASHGVAVSGNQLAFTPAAGFAGAITLSYTASDSSGQSATGVVTLTVTPALPLAPPVPLPDMATVSTLGAAFTDIDVLTNDINPAGGTLSLSSAAITLAVPLDAGSVSVAGNRVRYTPATGYAGAVTVSYTVTDANGQNGTGVLVITALPLL